MMFADEGLVVAEIVEPLDQLDVAIERSVGFSPTR